MQLTPYQQEAVERDGHQLLLVASAGSGKTEVLTQRVIRHLKESSGQTFRVLAVTFTKRAALELDRRLQASTSNEAWRVDAETIHGFALDWLMRFGQAVNVFPDTVVYADDTDRLDILAVLLRSLGEQQNDDLRPLLRAIDEHRTRGASQHDDAVVGPFVGAMPFADIYEGYLSALEAANGIDFAGMLTKFLEAADVDPRFLENFSSVYRFVLVDEGQDLSPAQAAVVRCLTSGPVDLFIVADDRQSINGFAGGAFANALSLIGEEAASSALNLPHNFRCATNVLAAADRLAAHLTPRPPQAFAVENAPAGRVRLLPTPSQLDEAELIYRWVSSLLESGLDPATLAQGEDPSVRPEEIALVARTRWLLDPVVNVLTHHGLDLSLQTDTETLLQTPLGRLLSEGLALESSEENAPAARRFCDELKGIGITIDPKGLNSSAVLRASGLVDLAALAVALDGINASNFEDRFRALRDGIDDIDDKGLSTDFDIIGTMWSSFAVAVPHHKRDLAGFVRYMSRAQQTRPSDPGVRVLTIHKVKGLEFKAVCLLGAYNGAIPDYRATKPSAVDEERRAFYVAMTRASRELIITYPEVTVDKYGGSHRQLPSRFTNEAGLEVGV